MNMGQLEFTHFEKLFGSFSKTKPHPLCHPDIIQMHEFVCKFRKMDTKKWTKIFMAALLK